MRLGYLLVVVVATLLAVSCDVTSAESSTPSTRLLRTAGEQTPERRLVKKLPASFVRDLLKDKTKLEGTLTSWQESGLDVKRLAKSLGLSSNWVKMLRNAKNHGKVDLLKLYRARVGPKAK
ncbi:hypothetical protein PF005_g8637 [Phytophthora fragariae]|uniref:RxLR effector protein n=1 Tax=Phytophthora fragariae TaxID=53985 RepID=A0A6A3F822_9STRA|nr:hypothetical protein PF003_g30633 [Phytophthora fragariae]KAE8940571.1 hypothetical protein PF009_g9627 [Phytophthora fragariae]KAE9015670.1 hypothetical protein PF011_g7513 [Phytophthora fragariae]KAE9118606.1 hypothetical protein PF007_g8874 [Phytophthora fragariae]KAE9119400.1 hypothetical protein PF010_g7886 [Phytophthora fragariae]